MLMYALWHCYELACPWNQLLIVQQCFLNDSRRHCSVGIYCTLLACYPPISQRSLCPHGWISWGVWNSCALSHFDRAPSTQDSLPPLRKFPQGSISSITQLLGRLSIHQVLVSDFILIGIKLFVNRTLRKFSVHVVFKWRRSNEKRIVWVHLSHSS